MVVKLIVIALYAAMIVYIGMIGLKKTKSFNDFVLGGGNVGPWMSALSYGTAYFSAVLFIGFAGKVGWQFGYSGLWIGLFNGIIGVFLVWKVIGWRIRKISAEYQVGTMSELLEKRYSSPALKLIASIVIFIFMIPYSAAVFMGLSYLFTTTFGINYEVILIFMGVFTALYVIMGGYQAMALIDMIFGIIMTIGVAVLYFSTVDKGGGIASITESLNAISPSLTAPIGKPGFWPLFSLIFLTSVAPFAMPQLVAKFYAIKDERSVKIGTWASTFFALLIGGVAYFIGSTTHVFLTPEATPNAFIDGQPNFDRLMPELLTNVIPESLSVIILLLILSASMSTLASLVLISSSSFSKDFWAGFVNKSMTDKSLVSMMRWMSAGFILLAVLLAWVEIDVIVEILGISWGALGSFFLGPFIWGIFSSKVNKYGAYASAILGLCTTLALYFYGLSIEGAKDWYFTSPGAGTVGMIISLIINPLVSSVVKPKS